MKLAGRIAKGLVVFVIFFLNALFILRCCFAADQRTLAALIPTPALRAAYAAADGEPEILTHKVVREISENGYMSAYSFAWAPQAREVQITVRYNDSVYSYNDLPEETEFRFVLTDSASGAQFTPDVAASEEKLMYNYRRLVFSGVEVSETSDLTLIMYCGDEEITRDVIHYADQNVVNEPYKLSRAEREALGG